MKITSSPWGMVQTQKDLAPGITAVTTASHGGIYVAPDLLAKMPIKSTAYSQAGSVLAAGRRWPEGTGLRQGQGHAPPVHDRQR